MPPKRGRQEDADVDPSIFRSSRESKKCNECRRRHVKCDEQRPKCTNCVKSNADCSYSHSGMRYDHISDRQKRDDMYTEIDDISKRVQGLLSEVQSEPTHDDVARLALDYGWQVTLAPDGRKRIVTNIETTAQLAALVPRALDNVYGTNTGLRGVAAPPRNALPAPTSTAVAAEGDVLHLPVRTSLQQYMQPYTTGPLPCACPCMFAFLMSPSLLLHASADPELVMLATTIHSDRSLYSCIHSPDGPFVGDTLPALPSTVPLPQLTRFGDCTLSNVFWNLVKTARLIDQGEFSQAYVNIGVSITKALSLQLHRPAPGATAIEAEMRRRIFWSMWLLDTQMPLLHERRATIQLGDIGIDRPAVCDGMTDEDKAYTECLQHLIDARWLRMQIEHSIKAMMHEKDEHKLLNMVIQQVRQLRRFYERVDDRYKLERVHSPDPCSQWERCSLFTLLLEHALNWLVLFDRFLPAVPDPTMLSGKRFPDNLAVCMCRQAADVMTLLFEKWIWDKYDCQFRFFFNHLCNTVTVHKYLCRCPGVSTVHKWKAYASLQFIYNLIARIPDLCNCSVGKKLMEDLVFALDDLRDVTEIGWNPSQDAGDLIESITKYFSEWRPSYDPLPPQDSSNLFAKESSTMFTIIDMRKKAAADMTLALVVDPSFK